MKVIDPRNFDLNSINEDKISNTIESFYKNDKSGFLQSYSELADVDKFFTLTSTVLTFSNVENAKMMYLEELKGDLRILKVLNMPNQSASYQDLVGQLPKNYTSYMKDNVVHSFISKFENIANQIKNNLKIILES
jgi:hypothetical protein